MKKVWVLMATFHTIIAKVWHKYRLHYLADQLANQRGLSSSRIKGIFKLTMKRMFAQYEQEEEVYDKFNA